MPMQLVPNLLGMFVYTDERCPRFDPPKLLGVGGRYYINPADIEWFHRWEAAHRPVTWKAQDDAIAPRAWMPWNWRLR